jgi:hypothetical protein
MMKRAAGPCGPAVFFVGGAMPEKYVPMPFPSAGIDVSGEQMQQRAGTTPDATNVRLRESIHKRLRGGSRPGLDKYIPAAITGASRIQSLETIVTTDGAAISDTVFDPAMERFEPGSSSIPSFEGWVDIDDPYQLVDPTGWKTTDQRDNLSTTNPTGTVPSSYKKPVKKKGTGNQPTMVKKSRVKITWPIPADIRYPTPLNGTQLNATATSPSTGEVVDGTFAYNPPKLTVLDVGVNRNLRLVFNPTNLEKWIPTTSTNRITVLGYESEYITIDGKVFPKVITVTYQWGEFTWATTGVMGFNDATTIHWEIQGIPHTLVDICNHDPVGILKLFHYSGSSETLVQYNAGSRLIEWALVQGESSSAAPEATTDVPLNWSLTAVTGLSLQRDGGVIQTNDFTIRVTGP